MGGLRDLPFDPFPFSTGAFSMSEVLETICTFSAEAP
jgi:hypothetical protein